ncbi:hypothetical protein ABZX93_13555 [Streptomyces sp. NPDC006632]|uniref:hypothetical protein n=1 Tax=Streptomyces sp. NPDC006632 TaxID=3157182 RepID=UPI0033A15064
MSTLTLDDLTVALRAVRLLTVDFPELPAGCLAISTIWPDRVELSFHNDLPGFEAWRAALRIDPDAVELRTQEQGQTWCLQAHADYAGADVRLVGFANVPQGNAVAAHPRSVVAA